MDTTSWSQLPDTAVFAVLSHLPHRDRAQASSTCKRWRECYYHPSFWRQVDMTLSVETGFGPATHILKKCGKFIHEITLSCASGILAQCSSFPDRDMCSLSSTSKTLSTKDPSVLPKYESFFEDLPKVIEGLFHSQGLQKFAFDFFHYCKFCGCAHDLHGNFKSAMIESLRRVIETSIKLRTFVLGYGISYSILAEFLRELCEKFSKTLQVLHISGFTGVNDASLVCTVKESISQLASLSVLTLNMRMINDQLLATLSDSELSSTLRQFNMVHVLGLGEDKITSTDDTSWNKLTQSMPELQVTMSVVVSLGRITFLGDFSPAIPLTSLRILTCYPSSIGAELIENVAKNYCKSLSCLELHSDRPIRLFDTDEDTDPLVMLCWKSKNLNHVVITGYRLLACNLLAMALLRGPSLTTFEVERDLIYHFDDIPYEDADDEGTTSYDSLHSDSIASESGQHYIHKLEEKTQEISKTLKRPWEPIERQNMNIPKFLRHDLYINVES